MLGIHYGNINEHRRFAVHVLLFTCKFIHKHFILISLFCLLTIHVQNVCARYPMASL
jgi:hypothetical protein